MSRRTVLLLLCLTLGGGAIALGLIANGPESEPLPPAPVEGGRILTIKGPDEQPVPGARCVLHSRTSHPPAAKLLAQATTDARGRVDLPVASGTEEALVVAASGFGTEVFSLADAPEVLHLSWAHTVHGLVLDLRGHPLPGARVTSPEEPPFALEATSDERGRFEIGPLPESAWLRAEREGFAPLDLPLGLYPDEDRDFVFYLVPEWSVTGRVVDSAGRGVPGAVVGLDQEARSWHIADEDGHFVVPGVLSDWEVLLTPAAPGLEGPTVTAMAGQRGILLPLFRPAVIEGQVVSGRTGEPVEEFDVRRHEEEHSGNGCFRISGLLPGRVRLEVRAGTLRGSVELDLTEGERKEDVLVSLRPLRWLAPGDRRAGHPVLLRAVRADDGGPAAGAEVRGSRSGETVRTGADGVAEIALAPGRHLLRVGGCFDRYTHREVEIFVPEEEVVTVSLSSNPEAHLELHDGRARVGSKYWLRCGEEVVERRISGIGATFRTCRVHPVDIYVKAKGFLPVWLHEVGIPDDGLIPVLLDEGVVIRGRCRGAGGHPFAKVVIEVEEFPLDARMETAGDGIFRVGGLQEGHYQVLIYARNIRTLVIPVEAGPDGVDLGDVQMKAPADLWVLVTTSGGAPVPGAVVETSLFVSSKGLTDGAGRLRLPGRNEEEVLRVGAEGYLDAWQEVRIPPERERVETTVRLYRPARLLLRSVDREGRPVPVVVPRGMECRPGGGGTLIFENLYPGPLEVDLEDRQGRTAVLRAMVEEGETRIETVIFD